MRGAPASPRSGPTVPPLIYGVLDDEVWATDVLIAYDSERIYFGFHARYEDPTIMRANRVERDRTFQDDLITLYFNTFMDQQRGYEFDVNGFGVQGEGVISGGGGGRWRGPPQRSRGRTGLGTGSSILAVRSSRMVSQRRWRSPSRAYGIRAHRMGSPTAGDVRILRATTNLQIPERLDLRNIAEFNSQDKTVDFNVLFNYQVDAGTVFYLGYDDHFQQADLIEGDRDGDRLEEQLFFTTGQRRTSRALFIKLQSLLRY